MKFKIDENLPSEAAVVFRAAGHDASGVLDEELGGKNDSIVWDFCKREGRTLVTMDIGFADIRAYPPEEGPGCIVLRLRHQDRPNIIEALRRIMPLTERETIKNRLWIVDEKRVRIRK